MSLKSVAIVECFCFSQKLTLKKYQNIYKLLFYCITPDKNDGISILFYAFYLAVNKLKADKTQELNIWAAEYIP